MADNSEKNNKTPEWSDIIKVVLISLAAMIILPIILKEVGEEDKMIFTVNTLSSEELAGESYTEKTVYDDSDMWENEVTAATEITCIDEVNDLFTELQTYIEFPIDINLANAEELMCIDGIGTVTAEKIISYRNMYGYFTDYNQLLKVDGIGEKKLDIFMDYIYISDEWLESETKTDEITETTMETTVPDTYKSNLETSTEVKLEIEDIIIINEEFEYETEEETRIIENEYEETSENKSVIFPIELNSATVEELMCIDGVGEYIAHSIVLYAQRYGFYSVDELLNIEGIGYSKLSKISQYVYVNSYLLPAKEETSIQLTETSVEIITETVIKSVNINSCSKYELMELPGIDASMADKIIAFREEIGGFIKIEELTLVEGMTNEKMAAIWNYVYI